MNLFKEQGVRAVLVRSNPYHNRRLSDPVYEPFWAEAQELNCTIALHAAVTGDMPTTFTLSPIRNFLFIARYCIPLYFWCVNQLKNQQKDGHNT